MKTRSTLPGGTLRNPCFLQLDLTAGSWHHMKTLMPRWSAKYSITCWPVLLNTSFVVFALYSFEYTAIRAISIVCDRPSVSSQGPLADQSATLQCKHFVMLSNFTSGRDTYPSKSSPVELPRFRWIILLGFRLKSKIFNVTEIYFLKKICCRILMFSTLYVLPIALWTIEVSLWL